MFNSLKDLNGNPQELWIGEDAIGAAIENTTQGEGVDYVLGDVYRRRVQDLLECNRKLLERARDAEEKLNTLTQ